MADRYWVGGTGTWNTTSTTNWSASSGGPSGASVPTVADSVFFDQASTYTVTMTGALACLDITVSAGTVTFATGTSPTLDVRGSMSLLAGTVWSSTGAITFSSTTTGRTITTNGVALPGSGFISFTGVGGGWTLGSALTSGSIEIRAGTFDTSSVGNYALTCSAFSMTNALGVTTVNLNASTVSISGGTGIQQTANFTVTFNAGTSQINLSNSSSAIATFGLTFNNVAFTSTTSGTRSITGTNTFNNLSVTAPSSAGVATLTFAAQQTINGTLSTTGTAGNRRVFFTTANYGISYDLVVNSAPSLTDADFRGLYVRGTSAPISGTRIGNRGECRGITFSAPKTVYWNLAGAQNWSANGWTDTSTGTPNTNFFPLPQDTATFTNAGSVTGTITLDTAIAYCPNVDMSGRTSAMTLGTSNATTVYGNWTNGSGTAFTGTAALTFSGGTTQTITSAGKTFTCPITVNTYGGTVQLADALNIGSNALNITNGTFDTKNFNVTAGTLAASNSNVRTITFGSSTVTLAPTSSGTILNFATSTNLIFNAGTSQLTINTTLTTTFAGGNQTFYNVSFTGTGSPVTTINGANTFNNLTFDASTSAALRSCGFSANQTINGTLTCAGASPVRRIFLQSNTIGTPRTLTVNSISATDCDFRDITLAGAASGASPTRAGNCGGNSGITFPAAKTVYWNLAGAQNWSATAWAPGSGGTPDINNFPLAQDTAVFDNTGSVTGTITINADWNIGTFDASLRTSAMTLTTSTNSPSVYGDWKFGTGVTSSSTSGTITFSSPTTETITSNGVQFGCPVTVNHPSGTVQLADALSLGSTRTLTLNSGTFDAVTYNVTTGLFVSASGTTTKMGTGTWTLSGTGTVWTGAGTNIASTSTIVLSDTSTTARTFSGGGLYYNKLTIGGTTGTSTLTISGANTFGELASTKTVAHTITFSFGTTHTIGKWAVTGTVGNVVTVNSSIAATAFTLSIAGPANSGIDYLSVRDCTVVTISPGEFYVGANSTNVSGNTRVIFTATPAARTLYWVGGTGNWSDTARWSTTDGSGSGAAIPTSLDAVNFTNLSNATAYTVTIDGALSTARCAAFTMAGPASGNVTFAGGVQIIFHGNVSFAATGITRTYVGTMNWAGNSSYTFTTNGLTLASACTIIGVGSTWTLGSAINTSSFTFTYGSFSTSASNYSITSGGTFASNTNNVRSVNLNNSTLALSAVSFSAFSFGTTANLTFNAGASQINLSGANTGISSGGLTFNNVSFTSTVATGINITGANTFNTLSFAGQTTVGINAVTLSANQTITTLTLNAGTAAAFRTFLASNTIGTQRTLTVTTLTAGAADYDFRDIAIAGGAAPISGTRFGDCKGNSGITFPAAKTVYYRQTGSANWGATGTGSWSATSGGGFDATQFPLAQDTAIFPAATHPASGSTTTVNANYNIGTIDMSLRTTNTMTLATGTNTPQIYGNWINGTGTTLTGSGIVTFAGRGAQTITSAGKTWTQPLSFNSPGGSVTLQDAFTSNSSGGVFGVSLVAGTFDANTYSVSISGTPTNAVQSSGTIDKTLAIGSATWTIASTTTSAWNLVTATNLTGTGTINLTSASAKTFAGGGISYSGITLDQGGAGALTITGNNTFKDITNTYSATGAATISLGATTQTVTNFTGTGAATRVLTLSGTSAASPATLIITGSVGATIDYINVSNVRGYPLTDSWKIGANSTNAGSLGFFFEASGGTTYNVTITETATALDAILAAVTFLGSLQETATAADQVSGGLVYSSSASESTRAADSQSTAATFAGISSESAQGSEQVSSQANLSAAANEAATAADTASAVAVLQGTITETATGADTAVAFVVFPVSVNETVTALDQVVGGLLLSATISELVAGSDSATARADFNSSASETAQGSDQSAVVTSTFNAQSSESGTASDAQSAAAVFPASLAELASASESTVAALVLSGLVSETVRALDSVLSAQSHVSVIAESATASDLAQALLSLPASVSETATGADAASVVVVFRGAVAEQLSSSDLTSVAASIFNAVSQEQAQAQDSVNAPGSTYNPSTSETAQALDTPSAAAIFPVAASETATIADQNAAAFTAATNISESATAADITAALVAFAARTAENASASDQTLVAPSTFNAIAAAAAQAFDSVNAPGSIYNAAVVNTAVALDSIIGAFLWNLIDDSQNPNWGDINNSQNPGWSTLNTAQGTGWTTISNPQAPGWTGIDDNQSPNWQNISNI